MRDWLIGCFVKWRQDAAVGQLPHRQRGRAARLGQQLRIARLRDVHDAEVERLGRAVQHKQDLQPLPEWAYRNVMNDR